MDAPEPTPITTDPMETESDDEPSLYESMAAAAAPGYTAPVTAAEPAEATATQVPGTHTVDARFSAALFPRPLGPAFWFSDPARHGAN